MQFGADPVHLHSRNAGDSSPGAALPWPERGRRGRGERAEPSPCSAAGGGLQAPSLLPAPLQPRAGEGLPRSSA